MLYCWCMCITLASDIYEPERITGLRCVGFLFIAIALGDTEAVNTHRRLRRTRFVSRVNTFSRSTTIPQSRGCSLRFASTTTASTWEFLAYLSQVRKNGTHSLILLTVCDKFQFACSEVIVFVDPHEFPLCR